MNVYLFVKKLFYKKSFGNWRQESIVIGSSFLKNKVISDNWVLFKYIPVS